MTKKEYWETYGGRDLCKYRSDDFDEWWDPTLFDWDDSGYLLLRCYSHFDKWWDPNKFDWGRSSYNSIYLYKNEFKKWWSPDEFNYYKGSSILALYFYYLFDKWWDPDKFDWKTGAEHLMGTCDTKFTTADLKRLLLNRNKYARKFARDLLKARGENPHNDF